MTTTPDREGRAIVAARGDVSRETLARLDALVDHVDSWRTRMNIIGPREFDRIWSRHIDDSLQLLPLIGGPATILDLGSGGGFPGLVLAAAQPSQSQVTLVESVGKKCAFLMNAVEALDLPATVLRSRVEALTPFPATHVTARAFAPLPKLLDYAAPWLQNDAIGLFHKGKSWQEELDAASRQWAFRHETIPSRTDEAAVIMRLSEVRRHG
ncbi:MAG: 16S rRNA (guanine(527)-N(7))-methyltransferase RsmG [Pseudomonadota bacterium]